MIARSRVIRVTPQVNRQSLQALGLVAAWPLNDGGGAVAWDALGRNHGDMANFTSDPWLAYQNGKGLKFDGVDDIITSRNNNLILGSKPRSWTFWVWFNSETGRQTLFSMGASATNGYQFAPETNGYFGAPRNIYVNCWNFDTYTLTRIPLNTWTHVSITYAGGTINPNLKIYFNGISQSVSYNLNGTLNTQSSKIWFGKDNILNRQPYNGGLADVRLYNRALSAGEIQQMYLRPQDLYAPPRSLLYAATIEEAYNIWANGHRAQQVWAGGHRAQQIWTGGHRIL